MRPRLLIIISVAVLSLGVFLFAGKESFAGFFSDGVAAVRKTISDLFSGGSGKPAIEIALSDEDNAAKTEEGDSVVVPGKKKSAFPSSIEIIETKSPPPNPAKILISEILYDAAKSDEGGEFIELYNASDFDGNLDGWLLRRDGVTLAVIGSKSGDKKIIKAGGYFLVGLNNWSGAPPADIVRSASLPNEAATVILYDSAGNALDSLNYIKTNDGESVERISWERTDFLSQPIPNPRNSGL